MNYDFDAAIFDMDGTLLDTMPYWRFTSLEYILAHRLPILPDMVQAMFATSSRKLIMDNQDRLGVRVDFDKLVRELEGFMNRHYLCDSQLKDPDIPRFLEELSKHGIRMCVATGSPRQYARNGLERAGILNRFEFITDNYEAPYTKDMPEYFTNLARRLGVDPTRCRVFEDALYAMKAAKAAGMKVCAIEDQTQFADREAIKALADVYIVGYRELISDCRVEREACRCGANPSGICFD